MGGGKGNEKEEGKGFGIKGILTESPTHEQKGSVKDSMN